MYSTRRGRVASSCLPLSDPSPPGTRRNSGEFCGRDSACFGPEGPMRDWALVWAFLGVEEPQMDGGDHIGPWPPFARHTAGATLLGGVWRAEAGGRGAV